MNKLINISKLCKLLNLIDPITKKPLNHVLRYWEKEFEQIKPKRINNHRYYSHDQIETIKMIKFLLKNKGMTISGVKNAIKLNTNTLDDYNSYSLKADYQKKSFKLKSKKILDKIKKLKIYGKKDSSKS
jgi:DNA-binding transcriptional MerR regulator